MPKLTITDVDGLKLEIHGSKALQAQIDRFEAAMQALVPALEGDDDVAGERAMARNNELAGRLNMIVDMLPAWNKIAEGERRDTRRRLAAEIRARRKTG
jgi:hypothetical protein